MTDRVVIWTDEQVAKLNEYQQSGRFHPFTCGQRCPDGKSEGVLTATVHGWVCPHCGYTQDWAHDFMFNGAPPEPLFGDG
jgi:endogenous inhibitor of DNA gyrase (YacG/DUF329 family)